MNEFGFLESTSWVDMLVDIITALICVAYSFRIAFEQNSRALPYTPEHAHDSWRFWRLCSPIQAIVALLSNDCCEMSRDETHEGGSAPK